MGSRVDFGQPLARSRAGILTKISCILFAVKKTPRKGPGGPSGPWEGPGRALGPLGPLLGYPCYSYPLFYSRDCGAPGRALGPQGPFGVPS